MEVHVRRRCTQCENGYIQHPAWARFFAEMNTSVADREVAAWFWDHEHVCEGDIPPEEVPCPACSGTGWVESWIPHAELNSTLAEADEP